MKRYIQILRISWTSTLIMSIVATILTLLIPLILNNEETIGENNWYWTNVGAVLLIAFLVLFANKYERRQIKKLKTKDLITRITKYKTVYTNQMLCYVLICIVCFVVVLLSKENFAILFDALAILLIVTHRPTDIKVKFDLSLTNEELSKFNHLKFGKKS